MELTGAALRLSPAKSFQTTARRMPSRFSCVGGGGGGFADEGHLRYYEASPRKARKAVEAVARDLSKLRAMGLVAGDQAKEKVLSEAAELLMMELNQMRDEEGETKNKRKEEKAAMKALKKQQKEAKKAAAVMNCEDSSSSESSESECEEEQLVKMSRVATIAVPQPQLSEQSMVISTAVPQFAASDVSRVPSMECDKAVMKEMKKRAKEEKKAAKKAMKMDKEEKTAATMNCCKDEDNSSCSSSESSNSECEEEVVRMSRCAIITAPRTPLPSTMLRIVVPQIPESLAREPCQDVKISSEPVNAMQCTTSSITVVEKPMMSRIEVCMGGKCKKSGSLELLQEFEKKVGTEGMVVGCKCMGKCGLGPNVRLWNQGSEEVSVQKNPLCIGVGLEDVGTIVAGFFGDNELGLKAA